jgi:hypothetical protein
MWIFQPVKFKILFLFNLLFLTGIFINSCKALPLLLRNASSPGGYADGCPRPKWDSTSPLAVSPEINERLRRSFPPGTPARKLSAELIKEGFSIDAPCTDDNTIKIASYTEKHYFLYQAYANIYWKVDSSGNIVWAEGFIEYEGL